MGSPLMPPLAPLAAHFSAGVRAAIDANNAVTKHLFLLSLYVHTGPAQATRAGADHKDSAGWGISLDAPPPA